MKIHLALMERAEAIETNEVGRKSSSQQGAVREVGGPAISTVGRLSANI